MYSTVHAANGTQNPDIYSSNDKCGNEINALVSNFLETHQIPKAIKCWFYGREAVNKALQR